MGPFAIFFWRKARKVQNVYQLWWKFPWCHRPTFPLAPPTHFDGRRLPSSIWIPLCPVDRTNDCDVAIGHWHGQIQTRSKTFCSVAWSDHNPITDYREEWHFRWASSPLFPSSGTWCQGCRTWLAPWGQGTWGWTLLVMGKCGGLPSTLLVLQCTGRLASFVLDMGICWGGWHLHLFHCSLSKLFSQTCPTNIPSLPCRSGPIIVCQTRDGNFWFSRETLVHVFQCDQIERVCVQSIPSSIELFCLWLSDSTAKAFDEVSSLSVISYMYARYFQRKLLSSLHIIQYPFDVRRLS